MDLFQNGSEYEGICEIDTINIKSLVSHFLVFIPCLFASAALLFQIHVRESFQKAFPCTS